METESTSQETTMTVINEIEDIIKSLVANDGIVFKSQQRGEADLTKEEKTEIACSLFHKSKFLFLTRFGKYLKSNHLRYFKQFTEISHPDSYEIDIILKDLNRDATEHAHNVDVRNRRYEALKQMVQEGSYFSEIEMMKRNPLLYEQLVGQYLTEFEKADRDKFPMTEGQTFVKILMEGIERDRAEVLRKDMESQEDSQIEEDEDTSSDEDELSIPKPSNLRWGEFEDQQTHISKIKKRTPNITAQERDILKEEFVTTMYQNFLDGKDTDFDYTTVDNNATYDNVEEMEHDAEDRYFNEEEPHDVIEEESRTLSSEDELDIYMNALNQHPGVQQLAEDINRFTTMLFQ